MSESGLEAVVYDEMHRHQNLAPSRGVFNVVCSCGYRTDHVSRRGEWDHHVSGEVARAVEAEVLRLRQGIARIIEDRYAGDFDGLIPKMKALLEEEST